MSGPPRHRCIRCGGDVHNRGAACRDCRYVDPDVCRALAPSAPRRKATR